MYIVGPRLGASALPEHYYLWFTRGRAEARPYLSLNYGAELIMIALFHVGISFLVIMTMLFQRSCFKE